MNQVLTENGDISLASTGNSCLDFYVMITRNASITDIITYFTAAWNENPTMALQILFNTRDIRNGKGEKNIAIIIMVYLRYNLTISAYDTVVNYFINYGCWKDLLKILEISSRMNELAKKKRDVSATMFRMAFNRSEICMFVNQLSTDINLLNTDQNNISLCAKWAPTKSSHYNHHPMKIADEIQRGMSLTNKQYRQMISSLRNKLNILERNLSLQTFNNIDFSHIPSVAMNKSRAIFKRQSNVKGNVSEGRIELNVRYSQYLASLTRGEAKINVCGLQPHEIVSRYINSNNYEIDELAENQWNTIVNSVRESGTLRNVTAVVDVSGSMNGQPMEVSIALGILVAECTTGPFHGKCITFETNPQWHLLSGTNLLEKVQNLKKAPWGGSTNMRGVFDLVLRDAIDARLQPDEMVKTLFIFTDMQFNQCDGSPKNQPESSIEYGKRIFTEAGYEFPNIICWNLRTSITKTIPIPETSNGYVMVSGFSSEMLKSVINNDITNPINMLVDILSKYPEINLPDVPQNLCINMEYLTKAIESSKFKFVNKYIEPETTSTTVVDYQFETEISTENESDKNTNQTIYYKFGFESGSASESASESDTDSNQYVASEPNPESERDVYSDTESNTESDSDLESGSNAYGYYMTHSVEYI